jgi:hypothetical protein
MLQKSTYIARLWGQYHLAYSIFSTLRWHIHQLFRQSTQPLCLLRNNINWQYIITHKRALTLSLSDKSTSALVHRNTYGAHTLHKDTFHFLLVLFTWEPQTTDTGFNRDAQSCRGQGTRVYWEHPRHIDSITFPSHTANAPYTFHHTTKLGTYGMLD